MNRKGYGVSPFSEQPLTRIPLPGLQEESHPAEGEKEEPAAAAAAPVVEESQKTTAENFQERRALAIATKAQEIEKVTPPPTPRLPALTS